MTTAIAKTGISFEEFVSCYRNDINYINYELIDGELVSLELTGIHEEVSSFIRRKIDFQTDRLNLPYFAAPRCLLKPLGISNAFKPDILILDEEKLDREPLWQEAAIVTMGATIKLAIEVVSSNWENDYARKYEDYEALEIPEYWIVDYLGIGGKYFIGSPKQPTVTICQLVEGEYQKTLLRRGDRLSSPLFPDLDLSCDRLFELREKS